jgi:hypothetical protein
MTSTRARSWLAAVVLSVAALTVVFAQDDECFSCLKARYWRVPLQSQRDAAVTFPETDGLKKARPDALDFGIAFSGGGTRAASATVGQLRALQHLGWLDKVRYITAVSGGAWAVVPFVYSPDSPGTLLGEFRAPSDLTLDAITKPNGRIAQQIAASQLFTGAFRETSEELFRDKGEDALRARAAKIAFLNDHFDQIVGGVKALLHKTKNNERRDKMYSRLLGPIFLDALIPNASARTFSWTGDTVADMFTLAGGGLPADMLMTNVSRPFMIVGATMVTATGEEAVPQLTPIEYTPMYSGSRRSPDGRSAGTYVSSWAYDAPEAALGGSGYIRASFDKTRPFSLADVIASTGAAPQLALLMPDVPKALNNYVKQAATVFPYYQHPAVDAEGAVTLSPAVPHGDGGLTDNLGLMPLLARGVKNVLVFFNTNTREFGANDDLKSLFMPVGTLDGGGDKTHNQVFESDKYEEVRRGYSKAGANPLVHCARGLRVLPNAFYNIASYDGLNLCIFYNADAKAWHDAITNQPVHALFEGETASREKLDDFPWYDTFGQNKPKAIYLDNRQVSLLGDFTSWVVGRKETVDEIRRTFAIQLP